MRRRGAGVQLYAQVARIERLHHREAAGHELRLVALQVPDQVPRGARRLRCRHLVERFLDAVLTDVGEARCQRLGHRVRPESFRHRDDRDRVCPPARRLLPRDFRAYVLQALGQSPEIHSRG